MRGHALGGSALAENTHASNDGADDLVADDFESAVTLVKGCPFVAAGCGVEVGELTVIPREGRLMGSIRPRPDGQNQKERAEKWSTFVTALE